jgi:toxin CcdB
MAQFDVYRNPRGGLFSLLLDMQSDVLSQLDTRVVVPLAKIADYGARPITRLNPLTTIEGDEYVLVFQELAAVPRSALGPVVVSLQRERPTLIAAADLILTGI